MCACCWSNCGYQCHIFAHSLNSSIARQPMHQRNQYNTTDKYARHSYTYCLCPVFVQLLLFIVRSVLCSIACCFLHSSIIKWAHCLAGEAHFTQKLIWSSTPFRASVAFYPDSFSSNLSTIIGTWWLYAFVFWADERCLRVVKHLSLRSPDFSHSFP